MLHKPVGILSATKDEAHRTVLDLIDEPDKDTLHLAGRLDRGSSGLVLLTNDGRWSKRLMDAEHKVSKVYAVDTAEPISADAVEAFDKGFYFPTEDITTLPSKLEIIGECQARVTLHEGRYHPDQAYVPSCAKSGCRVASPEHRRCGVARMISRSAAGAL